MSRDTGSRPPTQGSILASIRERLAPKITAGIDEKNRILQDHGGRTIAQVSVAQAYGGMRGIKCMVTETSALDPNEGIRFRGKTIPETFEALPKYPGSEYPSVESFWWFIMTGDVPTEAQANEVIADWKKRADVPDYVWKLLRAMPLDSHPMTMYSTGILAMQREAEFVKRYNEGMSKMVYWEPMLEDVMSLMAKLPTIAAYIYRMKYKADVHIPADPELDLGGNFAHQMGFPPPYDDVARMYFILHSDHESGNVSAHTTHLVASALSDAFYSLSAGINGLAGPLHGLANQEVLSWTMKFMDKLGGQEPTEELVREALWDTLNSGQVIPGYGHAVLRLPGDPTEYRLGQLKGKLEDKQ